MTDDTWPLPKYNPGHRLHLHALGVIAITYASFERSIDDLYLLHPSVGSEPRETATRYKAMNTKKRIKAIRRTFEECEEEAAVRSAVNNVLDYFDRCNENRNELLHAEQYPAMFGGKPETLYLIKRGDRRSPESIYMAFTLPQLRSIADELRTGIMQSAEIQIYLRYRKQAEHTIPKAARIFVRQGPPPPLVAPPTLLRASKPQT
jgi:hypothetical protein